MVRRVRGFIDLHCHWVAGIDDGVRTPDEGAELLTALHRIGFARVLATPHMRPGMFDNTKHDLESAYAQTVSKLEGRTDLPELGLSSEHYFDDIVFGRLMEGNALPYPGERAALVEFPVREFPARVADRFFDLRRRRIRPVLAHPERYQPVWDEPTRLDPLVDGGALLLLDVAALVGKYGRAPRRSAETLLEDGYYYAACSDAHRPSDVPDVARGIERLFELAGKEESEFMLIEGPRSILEGTVQT